MRSWMLRVAGWITLALLLIAGAMRIDPVAPGLTGSYFPRADWSGSAAHVTTDPVPQSDRFLTVWDGQPPPVFTVSWQGSLFVPRTGTYTIATSSDDGSWVYLDGTRVIDNGDLHGRRLVEQTVTLQRGVHNLTIQYAQNGGDLAFEFLWARDSSPLEPVPSWVLSPRRIAVSRFVTRRLLDLLWQFAVWAFGVAWLLTLALIAQPHARSMWQRRAASNRDRARPSRIAYAWGGALVAMGAANALAHGVITLAIPRLDELVWYVALGVLNGAVIVTAWWATRRLPDTAFEAPRRMLPLAVAVAYLLNIWILVSWNVRGEWLFGNTLDPDVHLYFCYGRQLLGWPASDASTCAAEFFGGGRYPGMEYPQGALALFAAVAWLAGDDPERFLWVFPLVALGFTLGVAVILGAFGRAYDSRRAVVFLGTAALLSPFMFRLAPVRYDIVPTFFLLLGVYLFLRIREEGEDSAQVRLKPDSTSASTDIGTSAALSMGTLLKWLPGLMLPSIVGYYVQRRAWREAVSVAAVVCVILVATLVPFYLWDSAKFMRPYQYQMGRSMDGQSLWFLIQYRFLDATHVPDTPWDAPPIVLISNRLITVVQSAMTLLPLAAGFVRRRTRSQWAVLGLCSVAIFTLTNRIFSPQFVLSLELVWAAAIIVLRPSPRWILIGALLLLAIGLTNFLVFPLWLLGWPWCSAIRFAAASLLTGGVLAAAFRGSTTAASWPARGSTPRSTA